MNTFNILIGGKIFTPKSNEVYENIKRSKEMNDIGITINGVTEEDLELFEIDKIFNFFDNGNRTTYFIDSVAKNFSSRSLKLYTLDVTGIEYTKKLQNSIIIAKAFTQPNDTSLTRYTNLNVVDRLLFDSDIWGGNTEQYIVEARTRTLLDFRSPDFTFQDNTLFEGLDDVTDIIDAVPRLIQDDDGIDIFIADELNKRNRNLEEVNEFRNLLIKQNAKDGFDTLYTRAENVFDTSDAGIIEYPSSTGFTSLRTDLSFIKKDNNAFIPTDKSIQDMIDVKLDFESFINDLGNGNIFLKINSTRSAIISYSELKLFGVPSDHTISLIKQTVEKKVYDILQEENGNAIIDEFTDSVNKANSFFYTQGQANIFGVEVIDRGIFLNDTDTLKNYIDTATSNDEIIRAAAVQIYNQDNNTNFDPDNIEFLRIEPLNYSLNDDTMLDLKWRVLYKTNEDVNVFTTKVLKSPHVLAPRTKISNQQGRTIDIEKLSYSNLGLIERLDVEETLKEVFHANSDDKFVVGDFVGNNIITIASYIYGTNGVIGKYSFDENANKLGLRVEVDSELRTGNIDASDIVNKVNTIRYQITLEEETNILLHDTSEITNSWFNEYLYNGVKESISMSYTANRTGETFDGETKYTNSSTTLPLLRLQTDTTGTGQSQGYMAVSPKVIGRSIVIRGEWNDPLNITKVVNSDRTITPRYHSYLGTDPRFQGEFETAHVRIGYNAQLFDSKRMPFIFYTTIDSIDDEVITTKRIEISNISVYKDRRENVIQQIELELKTNNRDVIIYPAFNNTHRSISPEGLPVKAFKLNEKATLSNRFITTGLTGEEYTVTVRESTSTSGIKLRVANSGNPFIIVGRGFNNFNELLYANNKPLNENGDTIIRYRNERIISAVSILIGGKAIIDKGEGTTYFTIPSGVDVDWFSSDTSILTINIDTGAAVGVGAGVVSISARSSASGILLDTAVITIRDFMSISNLNDTVFVGDTLQLEDTLGRQTNEIDWIINDSNDNQYLTLSNNGLVTGINEKPGSSLSDGIIIDAFAKEPVGQEETRSFTRLYIKNEPTIEFEITDADGNSSFVISRDVPKQLKTVPDVPGGVIWTVIGQDASITQSGIITVTFDTQVVTINAVSINDPNSTATTLALVIGPPT